MSKIIVAHPEKQHSYRMATAIDKMGFLAKYITTTYYKRGNFTYLVDKITKGKFSLKTVRKNENLQDSKIKQYCELRGIFLLMLRRLTHGKIINKIQNLNFDSFGKRVAKFAIKNKVDAVIAYDTNSLACFKKLEGTGIIRIMDTSIANRAYTKFIYEKTITNQSEWENFSEKDILLNDIEMKRLQDEINMTDYFFVPSTFVKNSLIFSGVSADKIHIIPYGVDCKMFQCTKRRVVSDDRPIKLLLVGECSYRKGIAYLLEAVLSYDNAFDLTVIGNYNRIQDLYEKYKQNKNIHFLGRINHDQLPIYYQDADIFVLPSLSEGLSLAGLEAMSCGLPIICSLNCGVNDLVEESRNGWIMEEISTDGLCVAMGKALLDRYKLHDMGIEARKKAEEYSWEHYEECVKKEINNIIGEQLNGN